MLNQGNLSYPVETNGKNRFIEIEQLNEFNFKTKYCSDTMGMAYTQKNHLHRVFDLCSRSLIGDKKTNAYFLI